MYSPCKGRLVIVCNVCTPNHVMVFDDIVNRTLTMTFTKCTNNWLGHWSIKLWNGAKWYKGNEHHMNTCACTNALHNTLYTDITFDNKRVFSKKQIAKFSTQTHTDTEPTRRNEINSFVLLTCILHFVRTS